jgi:ComF family protein
LDHCLRAAQRVWPESCVLCGVVSANALSRREAIYGLCAPCEASLPRLPDLRCEVCALPLTAGARCGACLTQAPAYDAVSVPYVYGFPVDALIQAYKYGGDLALAPVLAAALTPAEDAGVDALIPMPLSQARLRERGFNQAHELARHLGRRFQLPVLANAARRIADTTPQAALPWKERARNVRGAFVCDADLTGRHVAIVDDVMTTGATLSELARNLKRAGAARVSGWVVARTLRTPNVAK